MPRVQSSSAVVYDCPSCHARLRASAGDWRGWMRCPRCDRASLPPRLDTRAPGAAAVESGLERPTVHPPMPGALEPLPPAAAGFNPLRIFVITGLVFSLFMTLVSFLDDRSGVGAVFRVLSIVFAVLLFRLWRRPGRRPAESRPSATIAGDALEKPGDCQNGPGPT